MWNSQTKGIIRIRVKFDPTVEDKNTWDARDNQQIIEKHFKCTLEEIEKIRKDFWKILYLPIGQLSYDDIKKQEK